MPFLCILHGYATFRRFCRKSDIYTHFWTLLGDFALQMLCGGKAPWLNLSTGFEISKIRQELTKLHSFWCSKSTNLKKRKKLKTRKKITTLPIFIRFSKFQILLKAGNNLLLFVAMPFLCILHGYATFRRFCRKSDIYTHFWTLLGDFALHMLCGWKAPWLNLSTGFEISKIGQELTKLQSYSL
jgi:hypothetical protein